MHEGVSNSRDLVILFTHDYLRSPYTRKEFASFEAERAQSQEERHIIVLRWRMFRCEGYSATTSIRIRRRFSAILAHFLRVKGTL